LFILKEKLVIEPFGPIRFQEPTFVVALPGYMKKTAIVDDPFSRNPGHAFFKAMSVPGWFVLGRMR
jgi:hypothetical protein